MVYACLYHPFMVILGMVYGIVLTTFMAVFLWEGNPTGTLGTRLGHPQSPHPNGTARLPPTGWGDGLGVAGSVFGISG